MRQMIVILAAWLFIGAMTAAQGQTLDPAAAAVAASRDALGGEKHLAAVKTLIATGRTRQVRGQNLAAIEFEIAIELPDKYMRKDEIPLQDGDPTTVGFNGDQLIQSVPEADRLAQLSAVRQDFERLALGLFATASENFPLTFSFAGRAEAPEGQADVLDVAGPMGFSARLFLDARSHLPIMLSWQPPVAPQRGRGRGDAPPPNGAAARGNSTQAVPAPVESRLYFSDYRDVGGERLPFRLRRAVGSDTVEEMVFDGFKINARIDPRKFSSSK